jgi:hypothetical protein
MRTSFSEKKFAVNDITALHLNTRTSFFSAKKEAEKDGFCLARKVINYLAFLTASFRFFTAFKTETLACRKSSKVFLVLGLMPCNGAYDGKFNESKPTKNFFPSFLREFRNALKNIARAYTATFWKYQAFAAIFF